MPGAGLGLASSRYLGGALACRHTRKCRLGTGFRFTASLGLKAAAGALPSWAEIESHKARVSLMIWPLLLLFTFHTIELCS